MTEQVHTSFLQNHGYAVGLALMTVVALPIGLKKIYSSAPEQRVQTKQTQQLKPVAASRAAARAAERQDADNAREAANAMRMLNSSATTIHQPVMQQRAPVVNLQNTMNAQPIVRSSAIQPVVRSTTPTVSIKNPSIRTPSVPSASRPYSSGYTSSIKRNYAPQQQPYRTSGARY